MKLFEVLTWTPGIVSNEAVGQDPVAIKVALTTNPSPAVVAKRNCPVEAQQQ